MYANSKFYFKRWNAKSAKGYNCVKGGSVRIHRNRLVRMADTSKIAKSAPYLTPIMSHHRTTKNVVGDPQPHSVIVDFRVIKDGPLPIAIALLRRCDD